jgi:hypothetical protein
VGVAPCANFSPRLIRNGFHVVSYHMQSPSKPDRIAILK